MRSHLLQIIHFYGDSNPDNAAFAKWMIGQVPEGNFGRIPFTPFLLTKRHDRLEPVGPADVMPFARHFENMGQVFMRSGAGPDDTYALLMAGGVLEQHKHWDNNHFAIYKKGYLALDTGSRPHSLHTQNYYPRTIAHNCVLIFMPGEELPVYVDKGAGGGQRWGAPAPGEMDRPVPNDGGQVRLIGSEVVAFETSDRYSYAAGDATEAYAPEKCEQALRQIVFINPDYFVIFDRVISKEPDYQKTWLLHTADEPAIDGQTFSASHEQGGLLATTLLPADAAITKIGGPGKQFWVDGYNYAMPESFKYPDSTPLLGQWRIEVNVSGKSKKTDFLHFLQTGDVSQFSAVEPELVQIDGFAGVRFEKDGSEYVVLFGTDNEPSGRITITDDGRTIIDRPLSQTVMEQSGLFGSGE